MRVDRRSDTEYCMMWVMQPCSLGLVVGFTLEMAAKRQGVIYNVTGSS
jgi:hypothetical protein